MNPIFTKSSVEAKITDLDFEIFQKVVELKYNQKTNLIELFDNDFKLNEAQYQQYQPYLFKSLNLIEGKYFTKITLTDTFKINTLKLKNKIILKCYKNSKLALEISLSVSQYDSIIEKYKIEFNTNKNLYIIFASTFLKNENLISTKLQDLKLFKVCYIY